MNHCASTMVTTRGTKRQQAAAAATARDTSHVGKRVAKEYDGEIYEGTVAKFLSRRRLWDVAYNDGDAEEMDAEELQAAMALYEARYEKDETPSAAGEAKEAAKLPQKSAYVKKARVAKMAAPADGANTSPVAKRAEHPEAKQANSPAAQEASRPPAAAAASLAAARAASQTAEPAPQPPVGAAKAPVEKKPEEPFRSMERLPDDLPPLVVDYLPPVDALSFASVSRKIRAKLPLVATRRKILHECRVRKGDASLVYRGGTWEHNHASHAFSRQHSFRIPLPRHVAVHSVRVSMIWRDTWEGRLPDAAVVVTRARMTRRTGLLWTR